MKKVTIIVLVNGLLFGVAAHILSELGATVNTWQYWSMLLIMIAIYSLGWIASYDGIS